MTKLNTTRLVELPTKEILDDEDYVVITGKGTKKLKVKDITKDVEKKAADLEVKTTELGAQLEQITNSTNKIISVNSNPLFDANDISLAVNDTINKANDGDVVILDSGNYKLANTIEYNKRINLQLNGEILYIGTNQIAVSVKDAQNNPSGLYKNIFINKLRTTLTGKIGIEITHCFNGIFNFGVINGFDIPLNLAPNKYESVNNEGIQYCKFNFQWLQTSDNGVACICFNSGNYALPWINENTFYGGRIVGKNGIKTIKGTTQTDKYNNNKFYNIGCESIVSNGIDLDFTNGNIFSNFRFEQVNGILINESNTCSHNRFQMSQPIKKSKINIQGHNTFIDFQLFSDSGTVLSNRSYYNVFDNKNNDLIFNEKIINDTEVGLAHCNYGDDIYERYAFVLTDKNKVKHMIPCKELKTNKVENTNFTLDFLYRMLIVQSNNVKVTITVPNKFKYDGATFRYSTNWCTYGFNFIDESGNVQFEHEPNVLGTYECIYISSAGKFKKFKISDDRIS